ncbi:YslB family protein [Fructilactobacillus lindneri]|uniref:YslB family protein n=1 Tax=Fructilactobacillus lindneri TaxID=53444 RepID=UPI00177F68C2|nr:YslB family protein [Fructilactobacillus lindneri]
MLNQYVKINNEAILIGDESMSKKETNKYEKFCKNNQDLNFWGIELLRDNLLPDILNEDTHDILYWAGKNLAIKFPVSLDTISTFFKQSGFGNLELLKNSDQKMVWKLSGENVEKRIKLNQDADFMLETGFLAQTKQQISGFSTEAEYHIKFKSTVEITVISDTSKQVQDPSECHPIKIKE